MAHRRIIKQRAGIRFRSRQRLSRRSGGSRRTGRVNSRFGRMVAISAKSHARSKGRK